MWNQWPAAAAANVVQGPTVPPQPAVPPPLPDAPPPPPPSENAPPPPNAANSTAYMSVQQQPAAGAAVIGPGANPYEQYTAAQYAAMTPEQQYALQQHWHQWQTYQQEYAKWHAQYGEQYKREMAAAGVATATQVAAPTVYAQPQVQSQPYYMPVAVAPQPQAVQPASKIMGQPQMYNQPPPPPPAQLQQPPPQQYQQQQMGPWHAAAQQQQPTVSARYNQAPISYNQPPPMANSNEPMHGHFLNLQQPPPQVLQNAVEQGNGSHSQWSQGSHDNAYSNSNNLNEPASSEQQERRRWDAAGADTSNVGGGAGQLKNNKNYNKLHAARWQNNEQDMNVSGGGGPKQNNKGGNKQNNFNSRQRWPRGGGNTGSGNINSSIASSNSGDESTAPNRTRSYGSFGGVSPDFGGEAPSNFGNSAAGNFGSSGPGIGRNCGNKSFGSNGPTNAGNFGNSRNFGSNAAGSNNFGNNAAGNFGNNGPGNASNFGNNGPNSYGHGGFGNNNNRRSGNNDRWENRQNNNQSFGHHNSNNNSFNDGGGGGFNRGGYGAPPGQQNFGQQQQRGNDLDEESFDRLFEQWEKQFEDWKSANANHPDRDEYRRYEEEFEKQRRRITERRELMRRRRQMQNPQQQHGQSFANVDVREVGGFGLGQQQRQQSIPPDELIAGAGYEQSPDEQATNCAEASGDEQLQQLPGNQATRRQQQPKQLPINQGRQQQQARRQQIPPGVQNQQKSHEQQSQLQQEQPPQQSPKVATNQQTQQQQQKSIQTPHKQQKMPTPTPTPSPSASKQAKPVNQMQPLPQRITLQKRREMQQQEKKVEKVESGSGPVPLGKRKSDVVVGAGAPAKQKKDAKILVISLDDDDDNEEQTNHQGQNNTPMTNIFQKSDGIPGLDLVGAGIGPIDAAAAGKEVVKAKPAGKAPSSSDAKKIPSLFDVVIDKPPGLPSPTHSTSEPEDDEQRPPNKINASELREQLQASNISSLPANVANALQDPEFMNKVSQALAQARGRDNVEPTGAPDQQQLQPGNEHNANDERPLSYAEWQSMKNNENFNGLNSGHGGPGPGCAPNFMDFGRNGPNFSPNASNFNERGNYFGHNFRGPRPFGDNFCGPNGPVPAPGPFGFGGPSNPTNFGRNFGGPNNPNFRAGPNNNNNNNNNHNNNNSFDDNPFRRNGGPAAQFDDNPRGPNSGFRFGNGAPGPRGNNHNFGQPRNSFGNSSNNNKHWADGAENIQVESIDNECVYRPMQVFDYQNSNTAAVIDYRHKSAEDMADFRPVKTFDYGHASHVVPPAGAAAPNRNANKKKNRKKNKKGQQRLQQQQQEQPAAAAATTAYERMAPAPAAVDETSQPNDLEDISDAEDNLSEMLREESPIPEPPTMKQQVGNKSFPANPQRRLLGDSCPPAALFPSTAAANAQIPSNNDARHLEMSIPTNENRNTISIDEVLQRPGRLTRPKRICIILRGPPGSGKSHVARLIKEKELEMGGANPRILSIDDYFIVENDYEEKCPKTGKKIPKKEILYEFDDAMEETYMQYLIKSFKKTLSDNLYDFIIVDCNNNSLRTLNEFYCHAKDSNFVPYIVDLHCDLETCLSRNLHERSERDIRTVLKSWCATPFHYIKLDVAPLLDNVIEMEDVENMATDDNATSEQAAGVGPAAAAGMIPTTTATATDNSEQSTNAGEEDSNSADAANDFDFLKSKWENDTTEDNLERLDGTKRLMEKRKAASMADYLQLEEWEPPTGSADGQKSVRWADIEERRAQQKMRAIGFVVGQTDWKRMMDPNAGNRALNKTKYIERVNNRR